MLSHVRENLLIWHLGLESNDVVIEINGEALQSLQQFPELLSRGNLTKRHSLEVIRWKSFATDVTHYSKFKFPASCWASYGRP